MSEGNYNNKHTRNRYENKRSKDKEDGDSMPFFSFQILVRFQNYGWGVRYCTVTIAGTAAVRGGFVRSVSLEPAAAFTAPVRSDARSETRSPTLACRATLPATAAYSAAARPFGILTSTSGGVPRYATATAFLASTDIVQR